MQESAQILLAGRRKTVERLKVIAGPKDGNSATRSASRAGGVGVKRNQGRLPQVLPRVERVIEPESTLCPGGCGEMARIGEDRADRLDIVPAQFRVIATVRARYACRR